MHGRSLSSAIVAGALILGVTGFGTINGAGQSAEHERITRLALQCGATSLCLEPRTLDELAGDRGSFGAVGAPDRGRLLLQASAHCDGGDHLPTPGYPQSAVEARGALEACRDWMAARLDAAVEAAGGLLDEAGRIRAREVGLNCVFAGRIAGRAKCDVLEEMGLLLHAAQDFYAHSNWIDRAAPGPIGPDNPPGLGETGRSPWLDLRTQGAFPEGLISGCFGGVPEAAFCRGGRVRHAALNKDTGVIDPTTGRIGAGTSDRGATEDNFQRAVTAAAEDSADKWATLTERLVARYGVERGERMACALMRDDPIRNCP